MRAPLDTRQRRVAGTTARVYGVIKQRVTSEQGTHSARTMTGGLSVGGSVARQARISPRESPVWSSVTSVGSSGERVGNSAKGPCLDRVSRAFLGAPAERIARVIL